MTESILPFEIVEVLGEGAFGAVCVGRMRQDPLRRLTAIKVLKPSYAANRRVLQRFRDEARLLSRLQHPHIVRIEQLVEDGSRPFVLMELIRGLDIRTLLRKLGHGLPPAVAMEIARCTCMALHAAWHEASSDDEAPLRVIHRDIKPSNLLLSVHGQLKVADFGIATAQFDEREALTDSLVMGSRAYMAPERLDGSRDTPAVDVYGTGMTLFEMLTTRIMGLSVNPAAHDRTLSRQLDHINERMMPAAVAEDLRRLLHRMCAYDPELRPDALTTAEELERLVQALPDDQKETLPSFARRVVQPLYESRQRTPLQKALTTLEDGDFLREAGVASASPPPPAPELHRTPAIFLGALLGATLTLGILATDKAWKQQQHVREAAGPLGDQARVRFWFPSEVTARVGNLALSLPGTMNLPVGPHDLDLTFEDGRTVVCTFQAAPGQVVRYVRERGRDAISVNDGPAQPCTPMTDAGQGPPPAPVPADLRTP